MRIVVAAVAAAVLGFGGVYLATRGGGPAEAAATARMKHTTPHVIAYGVVVPSTAGAPSTQPYSPLVANRSANVALGRGSGRPARGVWCFALRAHQVSGTVAVVVSVENEPSGPPKILATAQWVRSGEACAPNEIEIQTIEYFEHGSQLNAEPNISIPFSFVVVGRT